MNKLKNRIEITQAVLNVQNLDEMVNYYNKSIGFSIIEKTDKYAILGVENNAFLKLIKKEGNLNKNVTGLYHIAYLVPNRESLSNELFSLLSNNVEIYGAADHGYSEALYLNDPEGNGIEIYVDKPKYEWDIRENGEIVGATEPLDLRGLLSKKTIDLPQKISVGTKIGHMHLSIRDLDDTSSFYLEKLGFDKKFEFPKQAVFMASGEYHHDIALNIWNSRGMELRNEDDMGLKEFTIKVSEEDFDLVVENFENSDNILSQNENELKIKDNQNIVVKIKK
ncbi:VOC family protein [Helcococcus bovis]|uniref:VOC family protein n=1 Tax=Helcococcus bovis TaxID=3153252 RepID=UPI0038BCC6EC